jgi:hypothetical protein
MTVSKHAVVFGHRRRCYPRRVIPLVVATAALHQWSLSAAMLTSAATQPVPTHNPRMSRSPPRLTPIAAEKGQLATWPSRTFITIASMKIAA